MTDLPKIIVISGTNHIIWKFGGIFPKMQIRPKFAEGSAFRKPVAVALGFNCCTLSTE